MVPAGKEATGSLQVLGGGRSRIRANDHRVTNWDDFVDRQVATTGMIPDRLRARGLVDAHRPDRAAVLFQNVGPDPSDVVGHLLVSNLLGPRGRFLELFRRAPPAATKNHVRVLQDPQGVDITWSRPPYAHERRVIKVDGDPGRIVRGTIHTHRLLRGPAMSFHSGPSPGVYDPDRETRSSSDAQSSGLSVRVPRRWRRAARRVVTDVDDAPEANLRGVSR